MNSPAFSIRAAAAVAASAALLLGACGGEDAATDPMSSTLRIDITDAPLTGVTKVWVQFTGIEIKPRGGPAQQFTFVPPKGYDLLTLQGGNAATLLGDSTVAPGDYEWIRLMPDATPGALYVETAAGRRNIRIPSGLESGLKLQRGFVMPAGGRADFTIDFDLAKSLLAPPGQAPDVLMKPVLRLVDNIQAGTLEGSFNPQTLAAQAACTGKAPRIYVYTPVTLTPDDLYNPESGAPDTMPGIDPLVTVIAKLNASGAFAYRISFLPANTYTVAFTCNDDDPAVDESALVPNPITFTLHPQAAVITAGQTTTANF
ncbi:MAG: hypothetical protein RL030_125 [Pseudomonadota bacterium]